MLASVDFFFEFKFELVVLAVVENAAEVDAEEEEK